MRLTGTGVPIVTPFTEEGSLDESGLRAVVDWVTNGGVDFVVPCGSNGEFALLDPDERALVIEIVAEYTDLPVLAGTGTPGLSGTVSATERAADAGADAALVVTPYYHQHRDVDLAAYYRTLADRSPLPIYLYSVPTYTHTALDPRTVEGLATHDNIVGMKDSSGDLERVQRYRRLTENADFSLLVGSGSIYAPGLDAGADGGVLALANVVPGLASDIYRNHDSGKTERARESNRDLVELNRAITAKHGVPGVKAAMQYRGVPAGHPRQPFQPAGEDVRLELETLVDEAVGKEGE